MTPETAALLIRAGISLHEAIRASRSEVSDGAMPIDLMRRLRAEMMLTADQLDADIEDELKRRGAQAANDRDRLHRDETDASREQ